MKTGTALLAVLVLGLTGCRTAPDRPETERTGPTPPAVQEQAPVEQPASSSRASFHPATYDGWLHHVPDGLPLTVGMPRPDGDVSRSHAPVRLEACGRDALRRGGALDSRAVTTTGPELGDQHEVRVFVDDRAAAAFLHRALTRVRSCPTEDHTTTTWTLRARPTRTGFVAVRTYADSGHVVPGADWWEASRTGNGVLLTSTGGEYLPDDLPAGIREHRRGVRPLVRSMCVFTPAGCPVDDPDVSTRFPLAAGYPDGDSAEGPGDGREGPSRALEVGTYHLCGRASDLPAPRDQLGASWSDPEDYRDRHLLTFPDAGAASAWIGELRAFWSSCPREPSGDGFVAVQTLRRTAVGGESWALVRHYRYHGAPGVGLEVTQVVRLGRAVLVDATSSEGGAGPEPEAELRGVLTGMTHASARVVKAMCVYTEAGCPR